MCTPNTTARAEGASKAAVTQFKVALTMFKAAEAIVPVSMIWSAKMIKSSIKKQQYLLKMYQNMKPQRI